MARREIRVKGTKEYTAWLNMKARCNNPKNNRYHDWGGRGIKVHPEFFTFEGFIASLGKCPQGYSLDRIDNNKNYEPGNVRWAPSHVQMRNRSDNRIIEFNGKSQTLSDWADEIKIPMRTLWARLNSANFTIEKALTAPINMVQRASSLGLKTKSSH